MFCPSIRNPQVTSKCVSYSVCGIQTKTVKPREVCSNKHLTDLSPAYQFSALKTTDTSGNCRNPVFSLGVSQHMH